MLILPLSNKILMKQGQLQSKQFAMELMIQCTNHGTKNGANPFAFAPSINGETWR